MSLFTTSWTLESATDENPHTIDVTVEYKYSFGSPDSWTEPGDPPEAEIQNVWTDEDEPVELSLTDAENDRVLEWIYNNPPEPYDPNEDY